MYISFNNFLHISLWVGDFAWDWLVSFFLLCLWFINDIYEKLHIIIKERYDTDTFLQTTLKSIHLIRQGMMTDMQAIGRDETAVLNKISRAHSI